MPTHRPLWPQLAALAALAVAVLAAAPFVVHSFLDDEPPPLEPGAVTWTTHVSDDLGYALDLPESFSVRDWGDGELAFQHDGHTVARLVWLSEEEADDRGLWPGRGTTAATTLGGRPAERHDYDHWDGPFREPTVSFVVPHRGKLLAIELRGDGAPDAVQRRMVESFRFVPTEDDI